MSWPPAIKTFTLTFGPGTSMVKGTALGMKVDLTASTSAVWAETGTPLIALVESASADEGMEGSTVLPHPDQDGFIDSNGNTVKNWTYRASVSYLKDGRTVATNSIVFTVTADQDTVDLDTLIPVTSSAGVVVAIPDTWSTSVAAAEQAAADAVAAAAGKYTKPADGIPATDLAAGARTSLAAADAALPATELDTATSALLDDDASQTKTKLSAAIVAVGGENFVPVRTIRAFATGGPQSAQSSTTLGAGDRVNRYPFILPVSTSRFRIKLRNFDIVAAVGAPLGAKSGLTIGPSDFDATTGAPNGAYAGAVGHSLDTGGDYTIPGDGSYWVSPWYDDPNVQLTAGKLYLVAQRNIIPSGGSVVVQVGSSWQWNASGPTGLDPATAPTASAPSQSRFEMQIEYETVTRARCVLFTVADSLVEGVTSGRMGCYLSWPMQWAATHGCIALNAGRSGSTLASWAVPTNASWSTVDYENQTIDAVVVEAATNDITNGKTLAQIQSDWLVSIANVRAKVGADVPIYAVTVLPRSFDAAPELVRTQFNTWLSTHPGGIAGLIDIASVVASGADQSKLNPLYDDGQHTHLNPLGYSRIAQSVGGFATV